MSVAFEDDDRYFVARVHLHVAWRMILFGQRHGAMPRCGNDGFSDTVKVELGRQLGQAVSSNFLLIITMVSIKSTSRLLPTAATGTPAGDEK